MTRALAAIILTLSVASACGWGSGSSWMQEPLVPDEEHARSNGGAEPPQARARIQRRTLGASGEERNPAGRSGGGRVLGTFRNTYYDFPREADHQGPLVDVMNADCRSIAKVPRSFYEAVCVQGSGSLRRGGTISFAKRDCACAELCPRTGQKICFEDLDGTAYPWGRGATGKPITPLHTVAADTSVLPLGTVLYIPELDGIAGSGCFVVEDRGVRVQGEHVDIFTGEPAQTASLERQVPSNQGVTVVLEAARCAALAR